MNERMTSDGYAIPKCWDFRDNVSREYVVRGVRNRREYAITGMDAREMSERTGVGGKPSYTRVPN
jgi:hypothetical protein